jgi:uroporphyrinogen-III synthase
VNKRIAVTRAQPDADATAARIRARGHEAVIAPLLEIAPRAVDTDVSGALALIFTSSNGVRAFPVTQDAKAIRVFAVGDATAEAARGFGFSDTESADGDVGTLAALVKSRLDPRGGKLIHVGGADLAGDLGGELTAAGFIVERRIAYAAIAATALPAAFKQPLDIVLFHSARAAATFIALGAPNAVSLTAACISPNTAAAARQTAWRRILVAPKPREDDLLDAALAS